MLFDVDNEVEEEVEVVANGRLLLQQQHGQHLGNGSENDCWEQVNNAVQADGEEGEQVQMPSSSPPSASNPNLLSKEQRAEVSWKRSNPSLDMMLYRTMMHE